MYVWVCAITYCRGAAVLVAVGEELIKNHSKAPNIWRHRELALSQRLGGIPTKYHSVTACPRVASLKKSCDNKSTPTLEQESQFWLGKTGIIICELFVNYNRTFCIKPLQKAVFEKNVKENNKITPHQDQHSGQHHEESEDLCYRNTKNTKKIKNNRSLTRIWDSLLALWPCSTLCPEAELWWGRNLRS